MTIIDYKDRYLRTVIRMKLIELSEVEILLMKSIWKLGDDITTYDIIEYLKEHYDRNYARSTVKTYVTKLKGKGY